MATPIAILLGIIIGKLLNKTRGKEMIASMILGFFADGIYQLVFLFLTGKIIPMDDPKLILSTGVGVKNTIDLVGGLKYSLDGLFRLPLLYGVAILLIIYSGYQFFEYFKKRKRSGDDIPSARKKNIVTGIVLSVLAVFAVVGNFIFTKIGEIDVPMFTVALIACLYLFNGFILKTKIGQEFRAVGQNLNVAKAAGINVDRVRILAIVLSTMFACWGQLIFLQNLGTINTYGSHTQVGFFAVGALVIGGASVTKANSRQAFIGVILLHILFIAAPMAGKNLFGEPQIGEYFRVFVTYGVIGLSVALHAWTKQREKRLRLEI
jgi:simple sugar transport system permease protein